MSNPRLKALVSAHLQNLDKVAAQNIAERAYSMGVEAGQSAPPEAMLDGTLEEVERRAIEYAYQKCDGSLKAAAKRLQIGKSTLYRKLRDYGLFGTCPNCGKARAGSTGDAGGRIG